MPELIRISVASRISKYLLSWLAWPILADLNSSRDLSQRWTKVVSRDCHWTKTWAPSFFERWCRTSWFNILRTLLGSKKMFQVVWDRLTPAICDFKFNQRQNANKPSCKKSWVRCFYAGIFPYLSFYLSCSGAFAQLEERPSNVPVWCNSTDVGLNHTTA